LYKFISKIPPTELHPVTWKKVKGPEADYLTADYSIDKFYGVKVEFARLIKLPPKGFIKRHSDNGGRPKGIKVYHAVIETNEDCINYSYTEPVQKVHLPLNTIWLFDTWPEHESFNFGSTNRIHLVIDSYD